MHRLIGIEFYIEVFIKNVQSLGRMGGSSKPDKLVNVYETPGRGGRGSKNTKKKLDVFINSSITIDGNSVTIFGWNS